MADEAYPIGPPPPAESYLGDRQAGARSPRPPAPTRCIPATASSPRTPRSRRRAAPPGSMFVGPPPAADPEPSATRRPRDGSRARWACRPCRHLRARVRARRDARGRPRDRLPAHGQGRDGRRREGDARRPLRERARGALRAGAERGGLCVRRRRGLSRAVPGRAPTHRGQVLADAQATSSTWASASARSSADTRSSSRSRPRRSSTPTLRERLGEAACRIAARGRLPSTPGPSSSWWTRSGSFYFLEMNTRLQVEHPRDRDGHRASISSREQLRVAAGEALGHKQADVVLRGAAIECRINAEDPFNGWMPSPGTITGLARRHRPVGARRLGRLRGLYGSALLRHAAREAHGVGRRPRGRHQPDGPRARRVQGGRRSHDDPGSRPHRGPTRTFAPASSRPDFSTVSCPR